MAKKFFVLGIGGTGMRCIESLIHLCAMGMFDDTEIHLLALDTDKNNGNFSRLKEVKEAYVNAKGIDSVKRACLKNTLFSAKIEYYEFSPNYEKKSTFMDVFNYNDAKHKNREEADLADLVFTKNVEDFDLLHGYRAQTHLGSMMMYHSIIEAAKSKYDNGLKNFLNVLVTECNSGKPKIFILGSVFGGTGASSIPIIPKALGDAANIVSNGSSNILSKAVFGTTLLTAYFNFKSPTADELKNEKVIATSDKFAMNSQAAMMFYEDDTTVKNTYKRFYMMGTDGQGWDPMAHQKEKITKTITGGENQKNDSHFIELLAACAALDFYNDESVEGEKVKTAEYVYRAINGDDKPLEFKDFVNTSIEKEFAKKFGMLIAMSFLCNDPKIDFVESVRNGNQRIEGFEGIDDRQVVSLKKYFELFNVKQDGDELKEGWIHQLNRSTGNKFLFQQSLFSLKTIKDMQKFKWNENLYSKEGTGKDWKFSIGLFSSIFDTFRKSFINQNEHTKGSLEAIQNEAEKLYKVIYDTLCKMYHIN